jgi:hypothetical protein
MKVQKITYWIATGILSALMLYTAAMYFVKHETLVEVFTHLGYPAYIIYPFAVAKILGIIAILTKKSKFLKKLAYAGFFYDFLLAASAHINAGDGILVLPALVCMALLIVSYVLDKRIYV